MPTTKTISCFTFPCFTLVRLSFSSGCHLSCFAGCCPGASPAMSTRTSPGQSSRVWTTCSAFTATRSTSSSHGRPGRTSAKPKGSGFTAACGSLEPSLCTRCVGTPCWRAPRTGSGRPCCERDGRFSGFPLQASRIPALWAMTSSSAGNARGIRCWQTIFSVFHSSWLSRERSADGPPPSTSNPNRRRSPALNLASD